MSGNKKSVIVEWFLVSGGELLVCLFAIPFCPEPPSPPDAAVGNARKHADAGEVTTLTGYW